MPSIRSLIISLAVAAGVFASVSLYAGDREAMDHGKKAATPSANKDAWLAKAKAAYPLGTCVISGDKLESGEMGPPIDYVYTQEGKPDHLVRLCCKGCIKDFNKAPAKYLKMIDDATAAKASSADGHSGHKH